MLASSRRGLVVLVRLDLTSLIAGGAAWTCLSSHHPVCMARWRLTMTQETRRADKTRIAVDKKILEKLDLFNTQNVHTWLQ